METSSHILKKLASLKLCGINGSLKDFFEPLRDGAIHLGCQETRCYRQYCAQFLKTIFTLLSGVTDDKQKQELVVAAITCGSAATCMVNRGKDSDQRKVIPYRLCQIINKIKSKEHVSSVLQLAESVLTLLDPGTGGQALEDYHTILTALSELLWTMSNTPQPWETLDNPEIWLSLLRLWECSLLCLHLGSSKASVSLRAEQIALRLITTINDIDQEPLLDAYVKVAEAFNDVIRSDTFQLFPDKLQHEKRYTFVSRCQMEALKQALMHHYSNKHDIKEANWLKAIHLFMATMILKNASVKATLKLWFRLKRQALISNHDKFASMTFCSVMRNVDLPDAVPTGDKQLLVHEYLLWRKQSRRDFTAEFHLLCELSELPLINTETSVVQLELAMLMGVTSLKYKDRDAIEVLTEAIDSQPSCPGVLSLLLCIKYALLHEQAVQSVQPAAENFSVGCTDNLTRSIQYTLRSEESNLPYLVHAVELWEKYFNGGTASEPSCAQEDSKGSDGGRTDLRGGEAESILCLVDTKRHVDQLLFCGAKLVAMKLPVLARRALKVALAQLPGISDAREATAVRCTLVRSLILLGSYQEAEALLPVGGAISEEEALLRTELYIVTGKIEEGLAVVEPLLDQLNKTSRTKAKYFRIGVAKRLLSTIMCFCGKSTDVSTETLSENHGINSTNQNAEDNHVVNSTNQNGENDHVTCQTTNQNAEDGHVANSTNQNAGNDYAMCRTSWSLFKLAVDSVYFHLSLLKSMSESLSTSGKWTCMHWTYMSEILESVLHVSRVFRVIGIPQEGRGYMHEGLRISQAKGLPRWSCEFLHEILQLESLADRGEKVIAAADTIQIVLGRKEQAQSPMEQSSTSNVDVKTGGQNPMSVEDDITTAASSTTELDCFGLEDLLAKQISGESLGKSFPNAASGTSVKAVTSQCSAAVSDCFGFDDLCVEQISTDSLSRSSSGSVSGTSVNSASSRCLTTEGSVNAATPSVNVTPNRCVAKEEVSSDYEARLSELGILECSCLYHGYKRCEDVILHRFCLKSGINIAEFLSHTGRSDQAANVMEEIERKFTSSALCSGRSQHDDGSDIVTDGSINDVHSKCIWLEFACLQAEVCLNRKDYQRVKHILDRYSDPSILDNASKVWYGNILSARLALCEVALQCIEVDDISDDLLQLKLNEKKVITKKEKASDKVKRVGKDAEDERKANAVEVESDLDQKPCKTPMKNAVTFSTPSNKTLHRLMQSSKKQQLNQVLATPLSCRKAAIDFLMESDDEDDDIVFPSQKPITPAVAKSGTRRSKSKSEPRKSRCAGSRGSKVDMPVCKLTSILETSPNNCNPCDNITDDLLQLKLDETKVAAKKENASDKVKGVRKAAGDERKANESVDNGKPIQKRSLKKDIKQKEGSIQNIAKESGNEGSIQNIAKDSGNEIGEDKADIQMKSNENKRNLLKHGGFLSKENKWKAAEDERKANESVDNGKPIQKRRVKKDIKQMEGSIQKILKESGNEGSIQNIAKDSGNEIGEDKADIQMESNKNKRKLLKHGGFLSKENKSSTELDAAGDEYDFVPSPSVSVQKQKAKRKVSKAKCKTAAESKSVCVGSSKDMSNRGKRASKSSVKNATTSCSRKVKEAELEEIETTRDVCPGQERSLKMKDLLGEVDSEHDDNWSFLPMAESPQLEDHDLDDFIAELSGFELDASPEPSLFSTPQLEDCDFDDLIGEFSDIELDVSPEASPVRNVHTSDIDKVISDSELRSSLTGLAVDRMGDDDLDPIETFRAAKTARKTRTVRSKTQVSNMDTPENVSPGANTQHVPARDSDIVCPVPVQKSARVDVSRMKTAKVDVSRLEALYDQLRALAPFPVFPQVCKTVAMYYLHQNPSRAAFYLSNAMYITFRHMVLLNKIKRTRTDVKKSTTLSHDETSRMDRAMSAINDGLMFHKDEQHLQEMIDVIPPDWSVVQISHVTVGVASPRRILTRFVCGEAPVVVQLPDAEVPILEVFSNIMSSLKTLSQYKEKEAWWNLRKWQNKEIMDTVTNMETHWLGHWAGLLRPREYARETIQKVADDLKGIIPLHHIEVLLQCCSQRSDTPSMLLCAHELLRSHDLRETALQHVISVIQKHAKPVTKNTQHVVLILDKEIQQLPWERMPVLEEMSVSRMPCLAHLYMQLKQCQSQAENSESVNTGKGENSESVNTEEEENSESVNTGKGENSESVNSGKGENSVCVKGINTKKTFYVLNPDQDCPNAEKKFKDWFQKEKSWNGVCSVRPTQEQFSSGITQHDLFIYIGHGAGGRYFARTEIEKVRCRAAVILMGCSSGKLISSGQLEPDGMMISYFLAGCPCMVANLWDVTDVDIDLFTERMLSSWLNGDNDTSLLHVVQNARQACKMKYMVGAAPVVYGLPVFKKTK